MRSLGVSEQAGDGFVEYLRNYIKEQERLKELLEENYTYWTYQGMIYRQHVNDYGDHVELLGPGGWTEAP